MTFYGTPLPDPALTGEDLSVSPNGGISLRGSIVVTHSEMRSRVQRCASLRCEEIIAATVGTCDPHSGQIPDS